MGIVQKGGIKLTIISYLGAGLGYVNKILLFTNFLSPDQVGLANILTNTAIIYSQFALLGMSGASIRFFPFFQDREKKHHGFLFWACCLIMVGFFIVTLFFLFCKPWIVKQFQDGSPLLIDYYYYLIPFALSTTYFIFFDSYLRSLLKTVVSTVLNEFVGRIFVTICVSFYAFKWINFHQFVVLYVLSNFLLTGILVGYAIYLKEFFIRPTKSRRFKRLFKTLLVYGLYSILSYLGASIILNVDSFMIASKLSLNAAGIYTTIFLVSTILTLPFRSIQKISHTLLARYWKDRNMKDMAILYSKTSLITMITSGLIFIVLWINIDNVFKFMPPEYAKAKYAFLFLAIGRYFDLATGLNGLIIDTSKKYRYDFWFILLLVILTVLMNLIFIPLYGIVGASIATMISLILSNSLRLGFVQYYFKMQPFTLNCLWVLTITAVVWGIALLIPTISNKFVDIAVKSAVVSILYGAGILLFKLSPDVNAMAYNITKLKFLAPRKKD